MPKRSAYCGPAEGAKARGFTLLEVVVALSILVICMTVIMRILGGSSRVAAISADYYTALQIAESKMAELRVLKGTAAYLETGTASAEGFEWAVEARPYRSSADDPVLPTGIAEHPLAAYQLFQLEVSVFWGGLHKREFQLSSLQLRTKDESAL
ncbi:MAG: prepilin-type N-terminal cleavage/methylation domain-containing protein [Gammaproteobacteria bacterium]|nr:prepilin-type N-terminal cleavage/methylation domain-containing protein [Gammaproteobacteria bacterium]MBQ0838746.1 prepilin-type N-terminal cleavage/methylation domain-containing protein [Gammaproteobacteria bacterium]